MKKTALLLPALLAGLSLAPAIAEPLNYQLLKFSETASRTVPNNWMTVRLKVSSSHADPARATAETTRRFNILQSRARRISGAEVELESRYSYQSQPGGRNSARVWEDVAVLRVSGGDFQALGKLIAESSGEATIGGLNFSLKPESRRQIEENLAIEALQNFRKRADVLSRSMGGSSYRVVEVSLQQNDYAVAAPMMARAAYESAGAPEPVFDSPGNSVVQQTVNGTIQY
ncbi:SIMPL domain-containing protein [Eikenella sp. S3360]|uniref:SIMPL domain-containing protein n=1 Tax=Eikenella glucosivorans TaxID=2766967 RepID=A0ABS0N8W4_9NEIS|nr:SIMPL domain-containing protein [Eikenella glucosivorans]MBH5328763.1 SIMPL domain-containing protein [Eikenella glucosivorans]